MSIVIEGGGPPSGAAPVLQKVEKVSLTVPELVKVVAPELTQVNASKVPQNEFKHGSIPPLTPVPKSGVPPLVKVEPVGPPSLVKVEKAPVVEDTTPPPLTLVKGQAPVETPTLQVVVKKEFTGAIFEYNDDDKVNLRRIFIGKEVDTLNNPEKLTELLKSICREEVIKEGNRKREIRLRWGSVVLSSVRFSMHKVPIGLLDKYKTVATMRFQVIVAENVSIIDGFTQIAGNNVRSGTGVFSNKVFSLMVLENSTDLNVNLHPFLSNQFEDDMISRSNLSEEFIREMEALMKRTELS